MCNSWDEPGHEGSKPQDCVPQCDTMEGSKLENQHVPHGPAQEPVHVSLGTESPHKPETADSTVQSSQETPMLSNPEIEVPHGLEPVHLSMSHSPELEDVSGHDRPGSAEPTVQSSQASPPLVSQESQALSTDPEESDQSQTSTHNEIDWENPFNESLTIFERAQRGKKVSTKNYDAEWRHFHTWVDQHGHRWGVKFDDIMEGKLSSCGLDYLLSEYLSNRFNMTAYRQVKLTPI